MDGIAGLMEKWGDFTSEVWPSPLGGCDQLARDRDAGAGGVAPSAVSTRICCSGRGRSPFQTRAADDVHSLRFAWLTNGKIPPAGLKPHDDLLTEGIHDPA